MGWISRGERRREERRKERRGEEKGEERRGEERGEERRGEIMTAYDRSNWVTVE